jgi:SAM-dependent methyltransferase
MKVLQNKFQIKNARQKLLGMGLSCLESPYRSLMRRIGISEGMAIGDCIKSWDVLETLMFLNDHISKDSAVLDIGCYASEVPVALHKMGYTNIAGADLNPDLQKMPHSDVINYVETDFMHTKFEDASFDAITSISVIEHGFDGEALLNEVSRLLKLGGYFIASFDYWPEKINTTGITFFGMDWKIFSKQEVASFIKQAADLGLTPVGELSYDGRDTPIECGGKKYTFGWLVLKKTS